MFSSLIKVIRNFLIPKGEYVKTLKSTQVRKKIILNFWRLKSFRKSREINLSLDPRKSVEKKNSINYVYTRDTYSKNNITLFNK